MLARIISAVLCLAALPIHVAAVRSVDHGPYSVYNPLPARMYWYYKEPEDIKEELLRELGCYCRKVRSVDDCPDNKEGKEDHQPEMARYFHPEVLPGSKKPHLCCKLAFTAWYNRVGWGYERQASAELCFTERRPVPGAACCRVGKNEEVALRVKQVESHAYQWRPYEYGGKEYGKGLPYFTLDDIAGGTDYDNSVLNTEQVRAFLQYKADAGALGSYARPGKDGALSFACSRSFGQMVDDPRNSSCRVRSKGAVECCCPEATVQPAERCLPAEHGASTVGPEVVNGQYVESKVSEQGDRLAGKIHWPEERPEALDKDLPAQLKSSDREAGGAWEYDWSPAQEQWRAKCTRNQTVKWIRVEKKSRRTTHRMGKMTTHRTRRWKVYHQEQKTECISWEYQRICPEGQGLYVKEFPPGTCATKPHASNTDPLQLVDIGAVKGLVFQCPEGYQSGTEGGMKFDAHCGCDQC